MKLRGSWIELLVLFTFGSLIETIFFGQMTSFTPLYLPHIGVQPADVPRWTGIIAAVTGLVGLPFLPFWGALADRFARKPVIIRSFLVEMITALLVILSGSIWIFLPARMFSCLALGNSGLMMTTLSEKAPSNRQSLAFSIMNGASPIGAFIGPLIGGPIVDRLGFRALLGIDAFLLLLVVLALTFGYRDRFRPSNPAPIFQMAGDTVKTLVTNPLLRSLFSAMFLLYAGWMLSNTYAALAVKQLYRGPNLGTMVGIVVGAGGLVALVLSPVMGALADRYGKWRVLFTGVAANMCLWGLPALAHGLVPFAVLWALINGISTGVFSVSFSVLSHSAPSGARGRVMSMAYLPLNLGLFFGPMIGSLVAQKNVLNIFPTAAVFTALSLIVLIFAHRQTQPSQP